MAIFVIGYKEGNNGERLVRLYNSDKKQTRDMKEKDLLFLKNDLKIMNASVEGKKLKGTTGSLEKVLNQNFFVIVSAKANKDGILGYNIVNLDGKELYVDLKDMPFFFRDCTVQNASLVNANNGAFVRGINWTIPVIEEKDTLPKNIHYGCAYSSKVASKLMKPNQNEVIISVDGFDNNGEFYIAKAKNGMGLGLGLSFKDYILSISEELFAPMVKELAKTGWRFVADKDNLAIRVFIDKPYFNSHLQIISSICRSLNCRLILNDFSDLTEYLTSNSSFKLKQKELEPVFTSFGLSYMLKPSSLDEGTTAYKIKEQFNIDIDSNNYFALLLNWRYSMVEGYHSYLRTLCGKYGIESRISDSSIYEENETNQTLRARLENNGLIYCSSTPCGKPGNIKASFGQCTYYYDLVDVNAKEKSLSVGYGGDFIFELYMDLKTLIQLVDLSKTDNKLFAIFDDGVIVEGFSSHYNSYAISLMNPTCNLEMVYKWFDLLGHKLNCKVDLDASEVIKPFCIEFDNNSDYSMGEIQDLTNCAEMDEQEFETLIVRSLIHFVGIEYSPVRNKRNGFKNALTVNFDTLLNEDKEELITSFDKIKEKVKCVVQHKTDSTIIFN